jgi:hypothetical protein
MKLKLVVGLIAAMQTPANANAQSTGGYYCGNIPDVNPELRASVIIFTDPAATTFADGSVGIEVCNMPGGDSARRECDLILSLPFAEFVAAQWVDQKKLVVETRSLQASEQQLELSIVTWSAIPATTVRIAPLTRLAPGSARFVGERKAMDEAIRCQMIPPPPPPPR